MVHKSLESAEKVAYQIDNLSEGFTHIDFQVFKSKRNSVSSMLGWIDMTLNVPDLQSIVRSGTVQ